MLRLETGAPARIGQAAPPAAGTITLAAGLVALVLTGALFGFFYAWICSTMWGLDAADPRVAIAAMQAMNASVRNAVFFPVFFLTAPVLLGAAFCANRAGAGVATWLFALAAGVVALGCVALTASVNVPMNEALGAVVVPEDLGEAAQIWGDYSGRWQVFNTLRTVAAGMALALSGVALWKLPG